MNTLGLALSFVGWGVLITGIVQVTKVRPRRAGAMVQVGIPYLLACVVIFGVSGKLLS